MAVSMAILGKQTTFPEEEDPERNSILMWPAFPLACLIDSQNSSTRKLLRHVLWMCEAGMEDSGNLPR